VIKYDPEMCARLIAEAREDDAEMTKGPWEANTDDIYVEVWGEHAKVIADCNVRRSGIADPKVGVVDAIGIARTRNNLRTMADQLEAVTSRLDKLDKALSHPLLDIVHDAWKLPDVIAERDSLRAQLEKLRHKETVVVRTRLIDEIREISDLFSSELDWATSAKWISWARNNLGLIADQLETAQRRIAEQDEELRANAERAYRQLMGAKSNV
jgi:hypothetical protein